MPNLIFASLQFFILSGFCILCLRIQQSQPGFNRLLFAATLFGFTFLYAGLLTPFIEFNRPSIAPIPLVPALNLTGLIVLLACMWFWNTNASRLSHFPTDQLTHNLQVAFEATGQGFSVWDEEDRFVAGNAKYREIMNYPDQLLKPGTPFADFVRYQAQLGAYGPGDIEQLTKDRISLIKQQRQSNVATLKTYSGTEVLINRAHVPGYGHITAHADISRLHIAEQELTKSEQLLNTAFTTMAAGVVIIDADKRIIMANKHYCDMVEIPAQLVLPGTSLEKAIRYRANRGDFGPGDIDTLVNQRLEMHDTNKVYTTEASVANKRIIQALRSPTSSGGVIIITNDITERRNSEQRLRDYENTLRHILESSPLGISILYDDNYEKRAFINQALLRMFGANDRDQNEIGTGNQNWVNDDEFQSFHLMLEREETLDNIEFQRLRLDGTIWWCSLSTQKITFNSRPAHVFWHSDITERKIAEKQLNKQLVELTDREERLQNQAQTLVTQAENMHQARLQLEKLNTEKDKFFSIIAHDLRGPFAGLVGVTELLADRSNKMDTESVSLLHSALHEAGQNLFKLMENLLEWSLLQRDAILHIPEVHDIKTLVNQNASLYAATAAEKGVTLSVGSFPDLPVLSDINMTNTVLRNLIHNAVKFTPPAGSVTLSAEADREWMWVIISDTGIGIPSSRTDTIFNIDATISTPGTNGEVGSGLGLHLCNELVKKNGGSIVVISQEGQGATFRFSLPLA